jgi:histidinol phosphatase-like PHP family hydrolase
MSWQPVDCHAHTVMSDGQLTVEELVQTVRARGVRPCVADHVSGDVLYAVKDLEGVAEYLEELERFDVGRGAEFCWHDPLWRQIPDALGERFTHWIGSLHAVFLPQGDGVIHAWGRGLPVGMTPAAYMELHLENLERLACEMPIDILAHPTLVPLVLRTVPSEELWTESLEDRAVRALARAGIAFEVSSRYRPHERLVRRAHDAGVRLALGSDGHTVEQVGDVAFPLALTRAIGVLDEELFDPFAQGSRTG